ncbi:MAG: DUF455 family protein [Burkholderiales bacterium]|nr:DUF455 family protein [Burkholderiales bacterium]
MTASLRQLALQGLCCTDPTEKVRLIQVLSNASQHAPDVQWATGEALSALACAIPGRPAQPTLVSPQTVERRSLHTVTGRAALIHALTHIEFNAMKIDYNECHIYDDIHYDARFQLYQVL